MDIQQQTKNVAAQGRFGDSMLLHVNPAEVKGLASAVPLTVNPETGQPEAFLPFLAPMLGSMLGSTFLTGLGGGALGGLIGAKGLSAAAAAGLGAGLATYAQTGGSGSKALLSGLTAGMGAKALNTAAQGVPTEVITSTPTPTVDPSFVGPALPTPSPVTTTLPAITPQTSLMDTGSRIFSGGFDEGMKNLAGAAMTPSGMVAGTAAGTAGVIQSQEEFERQMAQLTEDEEERKRRMYEMYPEQIPMAEGGRTGFRRGGEPSFQSDGYLDFSNPNFGALDGIGGGFNAYSTPARRTTRPISRGFMPGFMPEYSYFEGLNPSATALGYDPLGNFQNPQSYQGGYSQPSRGRGGIFGNFLNRGPGRGGYPGYGGRPQPPIEPPQFAGYGNPFMQSPSYQGFYGVPQMQQTLNPYARFTQQPMPYQPYQPYVPPVETPPDDGGGTGGGGTGGGGTPPIDPPIDIPGDGLGRKGTVTNPDPIAPPDDFVNPSVGGRGEPPIDVPGGGDINYGGPTIRTMDMQDRNFDGIDDRDQRGGGINFPGGTPGFYDRPVPKPVVPDFGFGPGIRPSEIINSDGTMTGSAGVTPPPEITIPIEGGADVTIPDFSRPQPPRPEPPMSIGGPGGGVTDMRARPPVQDMRAVLDDKPRFIENVQNKGPDSLRGNNMSIGGPGGGRGGIFGAPMFAAGGDTDLPNEGLEALSKTEKGREAVEAMGYQEGGQTDMMQDPITQDVIMFILGETDNENAINAFVEKYGAEQFMFLRDKILKQAAGNPDAQTEGLIQGNGNSGMADDLPMNIGDKPIAAVSQDEYIIPADVVSMLGDGSSDAGSKQLDGMLDRVRQAKTGGKTQAPPLNPQKVMPA